MLDRVCVLGSGSWGLAASGLIAPKVKTVVMWSHEQEIADFINLHHKNPMQLKDYELPSNVVATHDITQALAGANACICVVPSQYVRAIAEAAKDVVALDLPVLVLTKGLEADTNFTMSQLIASIWQHEERVCVLSGPNHAEEISMGKLSAATIASHSDHYAHVFQQLFMNEKFRTYISNDVIGVELCAAIKNVIAIACGIALGMGYGDNAQAVLMTRGLAEISRIVCAQGGKPMTCMGLAGMGDLIATCTSKHSRNRSFGLAFAQGETLKAYEARTHMIVEGVRACEGTWQLCKKLKIDSPLTDSVHAILYEDAKLEQVVASLLERIPHEEFYGSHTKE